MFLLTIILIILISTIILIIKFPEERGKYKVVATLNYYYHSIMFPHDEKCNRLIFLENEFGDRLVEGEVPYQLGNIIKLWYEKKIDTEELKHLEKEY